MHITIAKTCDHISEQNHSRSGNTWLATKPLPYMSFPNRVAKSEDILYHIRGISSKAQGIRRCCLASWASEGGVAGCLGAGGGSTYSFQRVIFRVRN